MLRSEDIFLQKADPVRGRAPRDEQVPVLPAEPLKGREFNQVAHSSGPRFAPHSLEQPRLYPSARVTVPHSKMRANLTQAHSIFAETSAFLPVQQVVQALRFITEAAGSFLNAAVRDVFDENIDGARVEFPS